MIKRVCKCGNDNQDDFVRGNICEPCIKKRAAEYRLSRLEKDKENKRKLYYKRKAEKAEREAEKEVVKAEPVSKEDKLFKDLLSKAKFSGRYTSGQLSKTRSNHI